MRTLPRIFPAALLILAACATSRAEAPSPAAPDETVYELLQVEVQPRLRNPNEFTRAIARGFPDALRAAGVRGSVVVSFIVPPNGIPRAVRVVRASHQEFIRPAEDAVQRMRFTPGMIGGRPVSVRIEQPIDWEIGGNP